MLNRDPLMPRSENDDEPAAPVKPAFVPKVGRKKFEDEDAEDEIKVRTLVSTFEIGQFWGVASGYHRADDTRARTGSLGGGG